MKSIRFWSILAIVLAISAFIGYFLFNKHLEIKENDKQQLIQQYQEQFNSFIDQDNTIYFNFDKSSLDNIAKESLDKQITWLVEHPKVVLLLQGHADSRGTREYNMALGYSRAYSAKKYFMYKANIADNRIQTTSFGKEYPVFKDEDHEDYAKSRRVETMVFDLLDE